MDIGTVPSVYVLDGGFSSQLSRHVGNNVDGDPLWTSRFLQTHPSDIIKTHLDFLQAGADVIMTNTYQASVEGFVKYLDMTPEEGYALIKRAVELAKQARDVYLEDCHNTQISNRKPLIVGSIGPFGAYLHDGSEYNGSYAERTAIKTLHNWHKPRIEALLEAGVDMLAFETLPCLKEAEVLVGLLKEYPAAKAWLSFSCKDDKSIANGENFQDCVIKCWDSNPRQLVAIGTNCCPPAIVVNLLKGINDGRHEPIPFIVYPNSGERYSSELGWVDRDKCDTLDKFVQEWLDIGVRYVGGCCRTYDTDIALIRKEVIKWCEHRKS